MALPWHPQKVVLWDIIRSKVSVKGSFPKRKIKHFQKNA